MTKGIHAQPIKLPTGEKLVLSSSPHLSRPESVRKIMLLVILSMLPAALAGIWYFGIPALRVILLTTGFCIGAEALWCKIAGKPVLHAIMDGSAAVTGLLLALNLPPSVPFYVPLIGAILAIWLGKQVFGGLGHNPFNPAIVARVGLLIALPAAMTTWTPARGMDKNYPHLEMFIKCDNTGCYATTAATGSRTSGTLQATTCATPLGVVGVSGKVLGRGPAARAHFEKMQSPALLKELFWGRHGGCIGETCIPALLLGGILLLAFNLINWRVPLCFIGTVAVVSGIVNALMPGVTPPALYHILSGGLMLGAFFMATDMVTSPITGSGCVIFAIGCGLITSVIRIWGNYPEGVSFSILFMNALVPLIDRWCSNRPFGYVRQRQ